MVTPNKDYILVKKVSDEVKSSSGLILKPVTQWRVILDGIDGRRLPAGTVVFLTKAPLMITHEDQEYGLAHQDSMAGWSESIGD